MRTRDELEQLLADPRAQQMLGFIRAAEGVKHGYNTGFGNVPFDDLSRHPGISKSFTQTDGKKSKTTAAGAYQFLGSTWNDLKDKYGLADFSPVSQDIGALALIDQKGALDDVLAGDFKNAISKTGSVWASFPSSTYAQPKKSWDYADQYFASQGGAGGAPQPPASIAAVKDNAAVRNMSTINAADMVAGALAGMSAPAPQISGADAFLSLRKEQLKAEADRLALASIDSEADLNRTNAVRSFFGEEPLAMATRKLPTAFEDALQEAIRGG